MAHETAHDPTYTASNGKVWPVADMPDGHIQNALAKLERDHPGRVQEIAALRAEIARREGEKP